MTSPLLVTGKYCKVSPIRHTQLFVLLFLHYIWAYMATVQSEKRSVHKLSTLWFFVKEWA